MLPDFPPLDLRSGVWARWAVWGRMTGGDVWSLALCPEARCDRMAQVKRGAIKEFNFVPGGKIMALRNLGLNRAYHQYE